jgi:hypothetical protein
MSDIHFPRETKGCYYQRAGSCCAVCYLRLARSLLTPN